MMHTSSPLAQVEPLIDTRFWNVFYELPVMKTKGALLWELNSPFRSMRSKSATPSTTRCRSVMHAAGMCHSDYHLTTGATPIALPALGGHEGAGVVTKVGRNVRGIEEGDHVILAFIPACGECPPCLKGYRSLCDRGGCFSAARPSPTAPTGCTPGPPRSRR